MTLKPYSSSLRHLGPLFLAAALPLFLGACADDVELPPEPLALTPSVAPDVLSDLDADFYEAVPYGDDARQVFDAVVPRVADGEGPTGLVIFFYGGGFASGDRTAAYVGGSLDFLRDVVQSGVAYITADYRLLDAVDAVGVIKPLEDGQRALQYIRYHAAGFNIDPERVVLAGASSGAGIALYTATNDDIADRRSNDPVARSSTRVRGVVLNETQATYDLLRWNVDVFPTLMLDVFTLARFVNAEQRLLSFYGITDPEDLESEDIIDYRSRVDMLELMTSDDPPMFIQNRFADAEVMLTTDSLFHHANHALTLRDRADEVGIPHVTYAPQLGVEDPSGETGSDFALRLLAP